MSKRKKQKKPGVISAVKRILKEQELSLKEIVALTLFVGYVKGKF